MRKKILIIEDEKDIRDLLQHYLKKEGYDVQVAEDGDFGLRKLAKERYDLVLLDLMLPRMDGLEVCRVLRSQAQTANLPVIMLTAKGEEIDRVVGFEVGADDYVIKPFSPRELLLRVKAVLRRAGSGESMSKIIKVSTISIDTDRHIVTVDGNEVILTTTEFKLLFNLAERLGRVQSRDRLLKDVWGFNHMGDTRTVDTHITRLRSKLGEAGEMIKTIRGFGYKMEKE